MCGLSDVIALHFLSNVTFLFLASGTIFALNIQSDQLKLFRLNGISHSYQLDQSISI